MEWIPIVFVTFKALVLGTGMFFAIKWHYDQGKKGKEKEARAVLRASVKVALLFVVLLVALGYFAFGLLGMLGNDMTFP
jgi:Na+-driven multidrug efflux pump